MPSSALDLARSMPRILERRDSETDRPAASSEARLMRRPVDSFSRLLPRLACWVCREPWPIIEEILWLILIGLKPPCYGFPQLPCRRDPLGWAINEYRHGCHRALTFVAVFSQGLGRFFL